MFKVLSFAKGIYKFFSNTRIFLVDCVRIKAICVGIITIFLVLLLTFQQ